ncbi:MAG: HNH endonuclease [Terriglobia bacterium]
MDAGTRELVRRRAENRCEYCLLPQKFSELTHHIEHIVAKQHGGRDDIDNLALACHRCNLCKGPNLTGIDPVSGDVVPLFHPRRDQWAGHFLFRGVRIEGITPVGRATVHVLAMNDARRVELRSELLGHGSS